MQKSVKKDSKLKLVITVANIVRTKITHLSPRSRFVLEQLIVAQLRENCPPIMEPEVSIVTNPYPEPDDYSSCRSRSIPLRYVLILSCSLRCLGLRNRLLPSCFSPSMLHVLAHLPWFNHVAPSAGTVQITVLKRVTYWEVYVHLFTQQQEKVWASSRLAGCLRMTLHAVKLLLVRFLNVFPRDAHHALHTSQPIQYDSHG